jgi:zinc protease
MKKAMLFTAGMTILAAPAIATKKSNPTFVVDHYSKLNLAPVAWNPPNPLESRSLLAKVPVYSIDDPSLPVVQFQAILRTPGLIADPRRLAARNLLGAMLVHGGTSQLTGAQLADSLEYLAASLSIQPEEVSLRLSLRSLSRDFGTVLNLLKESAIAPGFDPKVFELRKQQAIQALNHRFDRPGPISDVLAYQVLYGKNPQGYLLQKSELEQVTREQLIAEWKSLLDPSQMYLSLSGDLRGNAWQATVQNWLQEWPRQNKDSVISWPEPKLNPGLFVIDRPFQQTQVKWVAPFVKRPHPDFYAASLAAYILGGGGFGSRFVDQIRTKEGLAYSVWARAGSNDFQTSTVEIGLQTKAGSTAKALGLVRQELRRFLEKGPDSTELAGAKKALIDGLIGGFDTPESTVGAFVQNEFRGRPMDHFAKYRDEIQKLTSQDVQAAAQKWFAPERFSVTLVGPWNTMLEGDADRILSSWGEPKQWSLNDLEAR